MKLLALSPVHTTNGFDEFLDSLLRNLAWYPDLNWVILVNSKTFSSDRLTNVAMESDGRIQIIVSSENCSKAHSINRYLIMNPPDADVIYSIDSDIILLRETVGLLARTILQVPKVGYLSPRYANNEYNPEKNLIMLPLRYRGLDGFLYAITRPIFCNVAGGCLAMSSRVLRDVLGYQFYPRVEDKLYFPDDAYLYDEIRRRKLIAGYLENAGVIHIKSAGARSIKPIHAIRKSVEVR